MAGGGGEWRRSHGPSMGEVVVRRVVFWNHFHPHTTHTSPTAMPPPPWRARLLLLLLAATAAHAFVVPQSRPFPQLQHTRRPRPYRPIQLPHATTSNNEDGDGSGDWVEAPCPCTELGQGQGAVALTERCEVGDVVVLVRPTTNALALAVVDGPTEACLLCLRDPDADAIEWYRDYRVRTCGVLQDGCVEPLWVMKPPAYKSSPSVRFHPPHPPNPTHPTHTGRTAQGPLCRLPGASGGGRGVHPTQHSLLGWGGGVRGGGGGLLDLAAGRYSCGGGTASGFGGDGALDVPGVLEWVGGCM